MAPIGTASRASSGLLVVLVFMLSACATPPAVHDASIPTDGDVIAPPDDRGPGVGVMPYDPTGEIEDAVVAEHLAAMDLREKIGQRFMIFVPRGYQEDPAPFNELMARGNPAGVIVYRWNYEDRQDVIDLTTTLQTLTQCYQPGRALLISADQEGGRVAAFRFPDIVRIPSAAMVGLHQDPEFVRSLAYVTGRELAFMGVNMNLAPVLDLTDIPDSSIIGDRAWGNDPQMVSRLGEAYVDGMERAGVVATVKHFPGHGVTRVDSHGRLPVVDYTLDDLRRRELIPFQAAVDAGVSVVMTAHILFPGIDADYPVTISRLFMEDLLRREMGFDGVVISDGLEMGALAANFPLDVTVERAIGAGVDLILLYTRYNLLEVIDLVEAMVVDGRLSEDEITTGVERILRLKFRYGLLRSAGDLAGGEICDYPHDLRE